MYLRARAFRVLLGFLTAVAAAPVSAQNTVAIAQNAGPAVVTLKVYDRAGDEISQGSGFFVADGRIVTNSHVVEGATRVDVFDSDERLLGSVPHAEALSSTVDIAILPRLGSTPRATLSLDSDLPSAGAEIVVIGAPLGLTNTVATGIVSAVRDGGSLIQVTSPISPGSSGGPVLNSEGNVIGVAVAMRQDGQAINFAVPARDVAALLGSPAGRLAFPAVSDRNGRASTAAEPARADRAIALGETKQAALTSDDPQLDEGEHYHTYAFEGEANDRIVVSLNSTSFDAYLAIFTTDGAWEDQDDDSGGSSDAELNVTLPRSGRYVIIVTSYAGGETGSYSLSVRESDGTEASDDETDDWTLYGRTADDDTELYYLDSSIRRYAEGVFEVWTRWVYAGMQPPNPGGDPYDSEKRLMRVACSAERLGMVSFVEYSGESVVNSHTIRDVEMTPAVPGSVGATLLRMVCSNEAR